MGLVYDYPGRIVSHNLSDSIHLDDWLTSEDVRSMQADVQKGSIYSRLDKLDCLKQYSSAFGNRSDLIFVTADVPQSNNSLLDCGAAGAATSSQGSWMCEKSNTFSCKMLASNGYKSEAEKESAVAHWNIAGYDVGYCMASHRPTQHLCSVVYSFRIMIGESHVHDLIQFKAHKPLVVCCMNYCKCLCILYTAIRYSKRSDLPLSVLGDALMSFLKHPDKYTRGMALVSLKDLQRKAETWNNPTPRQWHPVRSRWASAASRKRWFSTLTL